MYVILLNRTLQARLTFNQNTVISTLRTEQLTLDGFPIDVRYWWDCARRGGRWIDGNSMGMHPGLDLANTRVRQRK